MNKLFKISFSITTSIIITIVWIYASQEDLIFFPIKTPSNYKYKFDQNFEEINIKTYDNLNLNGVLFKTDSISKGLIFYLHGNSHNIIHWSSISTVYNKLGYDIFILDYRSFGKSEGEIQSESQFYDDIQTAYDYLNSSYDESKIVITGYSIGTGPAAMLAANNNPKMLILQAPYYSLTQMMKHYYPFLPTSILEYKFETNKFIAKTKAPILIFHGDNDEIIPFEYGLKLKKHLKPTDQFITIEKAGHSWMNYNAQYQQTLKKILSN